MRLINNNISVDFETLFFLYNSIIYYTEGIWALKETNQYNTAALQDNWLFWNILLVRTWNPSQIPSLGTNIFFTTVGIINCNQQLVYCKISQMRSPANSSNLFYSLQLYKWVPALLFDLHGSQSCLIFNNST